MSGITQTVHVMQSWLAALSPQFAFLLALPFGVAAVGFAADALGATDRPAALRYSRASR